MCVVLLFINEDVKVQRGYIPGLSYIFSSREKIRTHIFLLRHTNFDSLFSHHGAALPEYLPELV